MNITTAYLNLDGMTTPEGLIDAYAKYAPIIPKRTRLQKFVFSMVMYLGNMKTPLTDSEILFVMQDRYCSMLQRLQYHIIQKNRATCHNARQIGKMQMKFISHGRIQF